MNIRATAEDVRRRHLNALRVEPRKRIAGKKMTPVIPPRTVILSEGIASRTRRNPQSNDPLPLIAATGDAWNFRVEVCLSNVVPRVVEDFYSSI